MLYCPKCKQTYEEGTRRFCADDEVRLLPTLAAGSAFNQTGGVFANVLSRAAAENKPDNSVAPRSALNVGDDAEKGAQPIFRPPVRSKIFKDETAEAELPVKSTLVTTFKKTVEPPIQMPPPRVVRPGEIPNSRAATLGERTTNPTGRLAPTTENTGVLVNRTIKGRYRVTGEIGRGADEVNYSALDTVGGKKVLIRVLPNEKSGDAAADKILAEELILLSRFKHPDIASVVDSGELPEGNSFIVTEYVEGKSVKEMLDQNGQFNALRAARIVRRASYALGDAHQNGILHRGVQPENIILPVSESGMELVKLINFGGSPFPDGRENSVYTAPELIDGNKAAATGAADIFGLAVVAFQMLTNRLPFDDSSPGGLLDAQREGLTLLPSALRSDVNRTVDEILRKALSFDPAARYEKARDFGDALFTAVSTKALWENAPAESVSETVGEKAAKPVPQISESADLLKPNAPTISTERTPAALPVEASKAVQPRQIEKTADVVKATPDLAWEKRSPEAPPRAGRNWAVAALLGAVVICSALGLSYYAYRNRLAETATVQTLPAAEPVVPKEEKVTLQQASPVIEQIESPPPSRALPPPPDAIYFENSKQSLKSEAAKNFLGFSLYYPKKWRRNEAKNNFLDVSLNAPTGTPVEQMLVSHYDSKGTFKSDAELFPSLVRETNSTLKSFVPNYKLISEGEKTVNNGWRAYEVKFAGAGKTAKGENIKLWGRRLFIPAARNGMKNGYVLTMLATSLSPDVKSVEDVGVKGDLHTILYSFEPNQNF